MASTQVTPTRMELTRTKKKLVTAIKGHKLLKDKRDELMRQFLDLVKVNMELREKVEAGIRSANKNFVIAKAGMDEATLNTALMAPKQEVDLEVGQKNVMSVDIPVFETKTRTSAGTAGSGFLNSSAVTAYTQQIIRMFGRTYRIEF